MTVKDALKDAARLLDDAGIEGPRLTAEALMAKILCTDRTGVFIRLAEELDDPILDVFFGVVKRRATREPLQHITGRWGFYGLDFTVGPETLIPRPETELLVDGGLAFLKSTGGGRAADIGTGSGCVAIAMAVNLPGLHVYAVDSSAGALEVAKKNAAEHGADARVSFLLGDLFGPLELEGQGGGQGGGLDLIVSNPPYIPTAEIARLQPEVRFEPMSALDGGPDGLAVIRRLIEGAPKFLRPGGRLLIEVGHGQSGAVRALVEAGSGLQFGGFLKDFSGIERVLIANKAEVLHCNQS